MSIAESTDPIIEVAIDDLRPGRSPRAGGVQRMHVRQLVELEGQWPPILVTPDLQIVDGHHRVEAARVLGHTSMSCTFLDVAPLDAFVESVRLNVAHGWPLSLGDRRRAAREILGSREDWSDRRVADVCGLAPTTVGNIRRNLPQGDGSASLSRIGRDGRRRTVDARAARERALRAIELTPHASSRGIAREIGVSPSTVAALRREHATPRRFEPSLFEPTTLPTSLVSALPTSGRAPTKDLAFEATPSSREFSAWFARTDPQGDWDALMNAIPVSRIYEVADEARCRSDKWARFASRLEGTIPSRLSEGKHSSRRYG